MCCKRDSWGPVVVAVWGALLLNGWYYSWQTGKSQTARQKIGRSSQLATDKGHQIPGKPKKLLKIYPNCEVQNKYKNQQMKYTSIYIYVDANIIMHPFQFRLIGVRIGLVEEDRTIDPSPLDQKGLRTEWIHNNPCNAIIREAGPQPILTFRGFSSLPSTCRHASVLPKWMGFKYIL